MLKLSCGVREKNSEIEERKKEGHTSSFLCLIVHNESGSRQIRHNEGHVCRKIPVFSNAL